MKIAILGAGISGSALARLLAKDGHQVVVLEKSDRAGGLCKSQIVDGFTFDEAGGHIMFSKNQDVMKWMHYVQNKGPYIFQSDITGKFANKENLGEAAALLGLDIAFRNEGGDA